MSKSDNRDGDKIVLRLSDIPDERLRSELVTITRQYRDVQSRVSSGEKTKKHLRDHYIPRLVESLPHADIIVNDDGKPILRKQQRTTQEISAQRLLEAGVPMKTIQKCTEVKISEYWTVPSTGDDPTHD